MAFMVRLLPRISANFTGGLGGVSGNARQLNGSWLPDLGSNQRPADQQSVRSSPGKPRQPTILAKTAGNILARFPDFSPGMDEFGVAILPDPTYESLQAGDARYPHAA
jgi:hypothetical protein